jgi:ubiquinone/menaquinone biosynthesis C-methylase UbiE
MQTSDQLKDLVRDKYSEIAEQSASDNKAACCGAGCCSTEVYNIMTDDYSALAGYTPDADLGLGCGLPTEFARIKAGDTVIDLGSGAGNDCFVARADTGEEGHVIGIDFTPAMISRARANAEKLGFSNVEFRQGDIEFLPVADNTADVIISNCVLNLVPNKAGVFGEMFRVMKPGAHFSISDIVLDGQLPQGLQQAAEMYAGCVSGAIQRQAYLDLIRAAGFTNITIQKDKAIMIPREIASQYLQGESLQQFMDGTPGIRSITVYAEKPRVEKSCCGPTCCN